MKTIEEIYDEYRAYCLRVGCVPMAFVLWTLLSPPVTRLPGRSNNVTLVMFEIEKHEPLNPTHRKKPKQPEPLIHIKKRKLGTYRPRSAGEHNSNSHRIAGR